VSTYFILFSATVVKTLEKKKYLKRHRRRRRLRESKLITRRQRRPNFDLHSTRAVSRPTFSPATCRSHAGVRYSRRPRFLLRDILSYIIIKDIVIVIIIIIIIIIAAVIAVVIIVRIIIYCVVNNNIRFTVGFPPTSRF